MMVDFTPTMPTHLILCPTCQKEISREATACPHCGAPRKKKLGCIHKAGIAFAAGLVLLVVFAVFDEGSGASSQDSSAAAAKTYQLNEAVAAGELEWKITNARFAAGFSSEGLSVHAGTEETVLVLVAGTVTNRSNREVTHIGNLYLVDEKGARYGEREDASLVAKPLALDSFNPNVPKKFSTLFEIPRSAVGMKFEATDFAPFSATTALIELGR